MLTANNAPGTESLQAKFGYTPMRVDYIVVVASAVAAKIARFCKLAPDSTIEILRVLPYTEYFGARDACKLAQDHAKNCTDLCVCLMQVTPARSGAWPRGTISLNIIYQAHTVISLIDNKIEYIKDRDGVARRTRTPEQRRQVLRADLVKWSKC
jgi:hypothetical protein|tara:strand:+ start:1220 stop:1681 length:462 start_codon:yes stop_codon:yes gene_type:complete